MEYNPWYTENKIFREQEQCANCNKWDKYIYDVISIKTDEKKKLCFRCYHKFQHKNIFLDTE
jgi:hypothetical protein